VLLLALLAGVWLVFGFPRAREPIPVPIGHDGPSDSAAVPTGGTKPNRTPLAADQPPAKTTPDSPETPSTVPSQPMEPARKPAAAAPGEPVRGITGTAKPYGSMDTASYAFISAVKVMTDDMPSVLDFHHGHSRLAPRWLHEYTMELPDKGRYAVALVQFGLVLASVFVDVGDGLSVVNLEARTPPRESYAIVTVTDPEGVVVRRCNFVVVWAVDGKSVLETVVDGTAQQDDGTQWVFLPESKHGQKPPADAIAWLFAKHADYGETQKRLPRPPVHSLAMVFGTRTDLVVTLAGFDQCPVKSDLEVVLEHVSDFIFGIDHYKFRFSDDSGPPDTDERAPDATAKPDGVERPAGTAVFRALQEDQYHVRLRLYRGEDSICLMNETTTVKAGKNSITLQVPRLHLLSLYAPSEPPGTGITLRSVMWSPWDADIPLEAGTDGYFRSVNLPTGLYTVRRSSAGANDMADVMRLYLNADQTLVWKPKAADSLLVHIYRKKNSAPDRTGLKRADVIVGVDGIDFPTAAAATAHLGSLTKGTVRLTLLRGGQRIMLPVEAADIAAQLADKSLELTPIPR
jgi:hypothetical protein